MPAYMIVDLDVLDADRFEGYKREVSKFIQKHGGEYIVRGGEVELLEGNWKPKRLVVMRFPSRQAIHNYLADPEYQTLFRLRQEVARTNAVAVDGV